MNINYSLSTIRTHWVGAKVHVTLCVDLYSGQILVFSMTLMTVCVCCHLCNKVLDIDNWVSVFYLFLFSLLKSFGYKKMSFSMV